MRFLRLLGVSFAHSYDEMTDDSEKVTDSSEKTWDPSDAGTLRRFAARECSGTEDCHHLEYCYIWLVERSDPHLL